MIWDNSLLKGLWDFYAALATSLGLIWWMIVWTVAAIATYFVARWAQLGDSK